MKTLPLTDQVFPVGNAKPLMRLAQERLGQAEVDRIGEAMAADAGAGFEYRSSRHKWTGRGFVGVADAAGARRQAREAVLERVVSRRRR